MSELPDRLLEAVGDEPVVETVDIGGGDALIVAVTTTYLYRSEGLLSDESIESYGHDARRLAVDAGRRKATVRLETLDDERSFTVPAEAAETVVEAMLEGVLRTTGVVDREESVAGRFRFNDLTLVVTDAKLFKHVGPAVWNEDFEIFDYGSLTDLDFEDGSVATRVVVEIQGRQHRVKVPNDRAGEVRRTVRDAVFDHHDVTTLGELRSALDAASTDAESEPKPDSAPELTGIDPVEEETTGGDDDAGTDWSPPADQDVTGPRGSTSAGTDAGTAFGTAGGRERGSTGGSTDGEATADESDPGGADVARLADRVDELESRLQRQNELLESQQETIEQLVEELRRGR